MRIDDGNRDGIRRHRGWEPANLHLGFRLEFAHAPHAYGYWPETDHRLAKLRHMRARASLSAADERARLRFMNPLGRQKERIANANVAVGEREMERKDKRVGASGGGEFNDGNLVRTTFLTSRVHIGINSELCRMTHSEIEESPGAMGIAPKYEFSPWSRSGAKRAMDVGIVLAFSPIVIPILAAIALAVLVTSGAPIFFLQERVGPHGVPFVIYKFRTMRPALVRPSSAIAIDSASRITRLGAFLRKSKLDELPQIFNVLTGEMSLVGPRPKVSEQEPMPIPCRPGLTGAATLAFAREETILQGIAYADLDEYFRKTILTAKRELDADYMGRATMWSDLKILVNTVLGRWESYDWVTCWLNGDESRVEASSQTVTLSR